MLLSTQSLLAPVNVIAQPNQSAGADTSEEAGPSETEATTRAEATREPVAADSRTLDIAGEATPSSTTAAARGNDEPAHETQTSQTEPELRFGDAHQFGRGRLMGLPHGSFARASHGLQSDYRGTGLVISGDAWIDTGYRRFVRLVPEPSSVLESRWFQQGRFNLRLTPTFTFHSHWFVQAQAEILAHAEERAEQEHVDTDDAWLKIGYWDLFDIQVGRFEAWEVHHKGLGLERDTLEDQGATPSPAEGGDGSPVVDLYEVDFALYRQGDYGQVAAHLYPTPWARIELGSVVGSGGDHVALGARPVAILDFDLLKLKVAGEFVDRYGRNESIRTREQRSGFGGGLVGIWDGYLEGGLNAAVSNVNRRDELGMIDRPGTYEQLSFGGFLTTSLGFLSSSLGGTLLGGSANYTEQSEDDCGLVPLRNSDGSIVTDAMGGVFMEDVCGLHSHLQVYGAIQQVLFDRALLKLVVGTAQVDYTFGPDAARIDDLRNVYHARLRALVWF